MPIKTQFVDAVQSPTKNSTGVSETGGVDGLPKATPTSSGIQEVTGVVASS
jgi:hypothetical protein